MLVKVKDGFFTVGDKMYMVDSSVKRYCLELKMYIYFFHEELTLPYDRKMDIKKLKDTIDYSNMSEVETIILNPSTADSLVQAKVAEGVMEGGDQVESDIKRVVNLQMYNLIATAILLFLFIHVSGILSDVSIPGVG